MARTPNREEINKMSYENRMARYKQDEAEILNNARGKSTEQISNELKKLIDFWKV